MRRMGSPEPEEPPVPPEAAPALTPEADITGSFDGSWGARCLGVASGGRAGAFGVAGLAGDVARQAASTASVEAGVYRRTGAVGIRNCWKPPVGAWSGAVRAGPQAGAPGAANGIALTGSVETSVAAPESSTAVISVVSTNGRASSTEPVSAETASGAVSSGDGTFTGEGGNGVPCTCVGTGMATPAPTLTCVTEPSFPGLETRIAILVLTCEYPLGVSD